MDKFENVKCLDDLLEMGDDVAIEFANHLLDEIESKELFVEGVKYKYGFTLSELKSYFNEKYATRNGKYLNKSKTVRKRKRSEELESPALTDKEILAVKKDDSKNGFARKKFK